MCTEIFKINDTMKFKGKGEHSVNELESICIDNIEKLSKKQLINQELLKALQLMLEEFPVMYDAINECEQDAAIVIAQQAINKALKG